MKRNGAKRKRRSRNRERKIETETVDGEERRGTARGQGRRQGRTGREIEAVRPHAALNHARTFFTLRSFDGAPLRAQLCEAGAVIFHGRRRGIVETALPAPPAPPVSLARRVFQALRPAASFFPISTSLHSASSPRTDYSPTIFTRHSRFHRAPTESEIRFWDSRYCRLDKLYSR